MAEIERSELDAWEVEELSDGFEDRVMAALERVFGTAPLYIYSGGSIPVASSFQRIVGLPVVLEGFTQPNDLAHAPNEWFDLDNYERAIRTIAATFDEIGALPEVGSSGDGSA